MARSSLSVLLFLAMAPLGGAQTRPAVGLSPAQEPRPPRRRDIERALPELIAVDRTTSEGRARLDELLAPFAGLPLPRESDLRRLRGVITKARRKWARLPRTPGEYWVLPATGAETEPGTPGAGRLFIDGETRKPRGLLIGLHGGGIGSGDASSSHAVYRDLLEKRGWLGLFPEVLEKTERGWTDGGTEEWIVHLIDQATAAFDVPRDHVYLTGHSMGGYGTWVLGAHHADLFAALAASAGAPTPIYGPGGRITGVQGGVIPNLRNTPLLVFQSTDDPAVPPEANQAAIFRIERARDRWGGYEHVDYWEVKGRGHRFPTGGAESLIERIEGFARNAYPHKLVWQPSLPWKRQFYWLDWARPQLDATVVAELFPSERRIAVKVTGGTGEGLAVLLAPDLLDLEGEVTIELGGEEIFRGEPRADLATWLRTATLGDPGREYSLRIPLD